MYKAGKKWILIGIATFMGIVGGTVSVKAETTSASPSQVTEKANDVSTLANKQSVVIPATAEKPNSKLSDDTFVDSKATGKTNPATSAFKPNESASSEKNGQPNGADNKNNNEQSDLDLENVAADTDPTVVSTSTVAGPNNTVVQDTKYSDGSSDHLISYPDGSSDLTITMPQPDGSTFVQFSHNKLDGTGTVKQTTTDPKGYSIAVDIDNDGKVTNINKQWADKTTLNIVVDPANGNMTATTKDASGKESAPVNILAGAKQKVTAADGTVTEIDNQFPGSDAVVIHTVKNATESDKVTISPNAPWTVSITAQKSDPTDEPGSGSGAPAKSDAASNGGSSAKSASGNTNAANNTQGTASAASSATTTTGQAISRNVNVMPATKSSESNSSVESVNKQATLPKTGEDDTSLLTVLGLAFITLLFGLLAGKNRRKQN